MFEMLSAFEFRNLYWLLLILPVLLGLWKRKEFGFVGKTTYLITKQGRPRSYFRSALLFFFVTFGFLSIIVAIADLTRGYTVAKDNFTVNRIFVALDNSSSMYNYEHLQDPIFCADKNLRIDYPRIYGACRALYRLIDETEVFAQKKANQKDRIGLIRFALYSFGQVPPTSDYKKLRSVIDEMNWRINSGRSSPLGIYTEIHLALWDMYLMALDRNRQEESGYIHIAEKEMSLLKQSLFPEGKETPFSLPHELKKNIPLLQRELQDTAFIFITDALKSQMETRYDKAPFSLKKMMELAALLQFPIYFISTDELHEDYIRLAKNTGSGLPGSKYRGDFLMVPGGEGVEGIEELMNDILQTRLGRTVPTVVERRESYSTYLALLALIFFILGLCLREFTDSSLTEV